MLITFCEVPTSFSSYSAEVMVNVDAISGPFLTDYYSVLLGFQVLWKKHSRKLSVEEYKYCYHSYLQEGSKGQFHFKPYDNRILVANFPDTNKGCKNSFLTDFGDFEIPSHDGTTISSFFLSGSIIATWT